MRLDPYRHVLALPGVRSLMVLALLARIPITAIAVTMNTYSHVIPALQDESAQRMDALFR